MAERLVLKLTYDSPHTDIDECSGLNSDGSINAVFTLGCLRNFLLENVNKLNKLLEQADSITGLELNGWEILVTLNSQTVAQSLVEADVFNSPVQDDVSSDEEYDLFNHDFQVSDDETNISRLEKINHLVNDSQIINEDFGSSSESEIDRHCDDFISDKSNIGSIIKKYEHYIEINNYLTDSDEEN